MVSTKVPALLPEESAASSGTDRTLAILEVLASHGHAGMTIADSAGTVVNDTYEYKVPPSFTLTGTGMQISIADSTENGSGTDNIYTIPPF